MGKKGTWSRKKRIRWIVFGSLGLAFLVVLILGWAGVFTPDSRPQVKYEYAKRRDIVETVTANGRIRPEVEVKISSEVSGEIIELHVIEGQLVRRGDLLCRIKPDIYQSMLEQSEASLKRSRSAESQAKERLALQKKTLERTQELYASKAVSVATMEKVSSEYELAYADAQSARHATESAEASLRQARENLMKTTIYAPGDYYVSTLGIEKGERVVGTAQMAGTEMMRLADLTRMEARVEVSESDVIHVHVGDSARVYVDAFPDTSFMGLVTLIANSTKATQSMDQVVNYEVRIFLLRESFAYLLDSTQPSPFKPGMSVTVDIMTKRVKDALSVPVEAVTLREDTVKDRSMGGADDNRRECIFVVREDTAYVEYVSTGVRDMTYVELLTPLADSARVIVAPYMAISRNLKNREAVRATLRKETAGTAEQ